MIINKANFQEFLIENIIMENIIYLIEDQKITPKQASKQFFKTEISSKLEDLETGYYLESPAYIYELVKKELAKNIN